MAGSIRALAMGAVFSMVAAGFAFAVPRAIVSTAERAIVEEQPIEVTEPIVDDTKEVEIEPLDGANKPRPGKSGGNAHRNEGKSEDARNNHGRAVSAAARCDVRGAAHGEVASSVAKNKDASAEDARAACDKARAAPPSSPAASRASEGKSRSHAPKAPEEKGTHAPKAPQEKAKGQPKNQSTSGSTPDGGSGSSDGGSEAPGKSGSHGAKPPKAKGGPKNPSTSRSTSGDEIDSAPNDSGAETTASDATDDDGGTPDSQRPGKRAQK